jgi:hypothetical protein
MSGLGSRSTGIAETNAFQVGGADFFQPRHVFFGSHRYHHQLATFVGGSVGNYFHAGGHLPSDIFGVGQHPVVGRKPLADGVPQKLIGML